MKSKVDVLSQEFFTNVKHAKSQKPPPISKIGRSVKKNSYPGKPHQKSKYSYQKSPYSYKNTKKLAPSIDKKDTEPSNYDINKDPFFSHNSNLDDKISPRGIEQLSIKYLHEGDKMEIPQTDLFMHQTLLEQTMEQSESLLMTKNSELKNDCYTPNH